FRAVQWRDRLADGRGFDKGGQPALARRFLLCAHHRLDARGDIRTVNREAISVKFFVGAIMRAGGNRENPMKNLSICAAALSVATGLLAAGCWLRQSDGAWGRWLGCIGKRWVGGRTGRV